MYLHLPRAIGLGTQQSLSNEGHSPVLPLRMHILITKCGAEVESRETDTETERQRQRDRDRDRDRERQILVLGREGGSDEPGSWVEGAQFAFALWRPSQASWVAGSKDVQVLPSICLPSLPPPPRLLPPSLT